MKPYPAGPRMDPEKRVSLRAGRASTPPAYQVLADGLRDEITSGRLRPGDRLPTEPQLCAQSGLSRSTVREALRLLSSQHLIVTMRGVTGGSFVAEPSTHKISEALEDGLGMLIANGTLEATHLFEVRFMLEIPAAELAARRRTETQLVDLQEAMFAAPADDIDRILAANRAFHTTMAAAAANALYLLVTQPLYAVANERELALQAPETFWPQVSADHREIMSAVIAGDGARAVVATRGHLEHLRDTCQDALLQF